MASTRGTKGSSSGGGSSSASSGGGESEAPKAKKPGLLSRIGKGLKRAVGKTARAVSGGSDKLAKRLGENYDEIANLYESGLFTIEEIENVVEGMKAARKNVGADKCWDGYKAKGTKKKNGREVPNCVKEEDLEEGCGGYSEGGEVNIRGNNSAEQKKRLEKKRGMKLDDHPQYKKEEIQHYLDQLDEEQLDEILGSIVGGIKSAASSGKMKNCLLYTSPSPRD